jgi:PIN domain nuclease of toxin-antitoxin system
MIAVVADTPALVWFLTEPKKLGKAAKKALTAADAGRCLCYVPVVALLEMWLLHERGSIRVGPAQIVEVLGAHPGYAILPFDVQQAMEYGALPSIRDPVTRILVAAARSTGARIISCDEQVLGHGVEVIWD